MKRNETMKMPKKEPLKSQIMTGYYLSKAVRKATKYFNTALECSAQALIDTNEDDVEFQNTELGDLRGAVYRAQAALQDVEVAHLRLSKAMLKRGYRKIVDEDFKPYGAINR